MLVPPRVLLAVFVAVAAPGSAGAQVQNGEIRGAATGAAGEPLPGVTVTTSGPALLRPRSVTTTGAGTYHFPELPIGSYVVSFRRQGWSPVERTDVRLTAGACARVDARLEGPPDREPVTDAAFDTRSVAVAFGAKRDAIERLPSARDPSAILQMLPGVTMSFGHSVVPANEASELVVDGGSLAGWRGGDGIGLLDVGPFDELHVTLAGGDVSLPGGPPVVSLVTKSASRRFSGNAHVNLLDRRLQSDNLTDDLRTQGAAFRKPVRQATDVGVEVGGPIRRNSTWLFGTANRARLDYRVEASPADVTTRVQLSAKVQHQWTAAHRSTLLWGRSETLRPHRGATQYVLPEATTRQSDLGFAQPLQAQHQWLVSDRLALDARYTYSDGSFVLDFQEAGLADVQCAYDRYTLVNWRSAVRTEYRQRSTDVLVTGTFLANSSAGGDHSARFGVQFHDAPLRQFESTGGGAVTVFDSTSGLPLAYQARIVRDGRVDHEERRWSAFLQDSFETKRLTMTAGLRVDRQDDAARPSTIPGSRILPDLLPAVRFAGADSGVVYNDVSPRLGFAWDLGGWTSAVLKAGAARHFSTGNATSLPLQPTRQTRLVFWWDDRNEDGFVERGELDLLRGFAATPTSNYDVADPAGVRTPATVARGLSNVVTDELTLGVENRLTRRLTFRASYAAHRTHDFQSSYPIEDDGSPVGSESFHPVQWTPGNCPAGAECPTITYFERDAPLRAGTVLRNDGRRAWRHAWDVAVHRRLEGGWMFDVSLTRLAGAWYAPVPTRDYADPTNIAMRNGTDYATVDARWMVKASAAVRLPWGFATSAFFSGRQGFAYDRVVVSPNRGALGSTRVSVKPYGSERYPDVHRLDWRLDRKIALGPLTIVPSVNVFNALNSNVVLSRNAVQNSRTANGVIEILAPRVARLDLSVSW